LGTGTSDEGAIRRLVVPFKVIYSLPQTKSFVRLIAETEDRVDVTHLHEELYRRLAKRKNSIELLIPKRTLT
jgi:hypothetical protein